MRGGEGDAGAGDVEAVGTAVDGGGRVVRQPVDLVGGDVGRVGEDEGKPLISCQRGAKVAFDGNFRPRGWKGDLARTRTVFMEALKRVDIALPTYDDEAVLWGDPSPEATVARLQAFGIGELKREPLEYPDNPLSNDAKPSHESAQGYWSMQRFWTRVRC